MREGLIFFENRCGVLKNDGGYGIIGLRKYLFICLENYVENDVVVVVFAIVIVAVPIGSVDVKLHIANPKTTVNFDFCVENIGSSIGIWYAWRDYVHALAEESLLFFEIEAVEPDVV